MQRSRIVIRLLSGLFLVAAVLLMAAACTARGEGPVIDLRARPTPPGTSAVKPPSKDRIVLAVAAVNSPLPTLEAYEDLANYLGAKLGLEARFVGGKTYAEINSLVRSGDATVAIVCSGAYVFGREESGMELLAAPTINGQSVYYSYLIAHKDSLLTSWGQLRGRTFAFTDPLSNSGRLVPLYQMLALGETPESFLGSYIFTYSHDKSITAVARGVVDAASVDSLVYDYALAHQQEDAAFTKVIWRSPPYAINPVVVDPNLDPAVKAKLQAVLLEMHETEEGREVLGRLQFDRFVFADDSAYDSIRDMVRAVGTRSAP